MSLHRTVRAVNRRTYGSALLASLTALALVAGCTSGAKQDSAATGKSSQSSSSTGSGSASTSSPAARTSSTAKPKPGKPVHVSSVEGDGSSFGVGMPLIINFSVSPTSRAAFEKAAVVTVNGRPAGGAWFWEKVYAGQPVEAHYRPQLYWPAHSRIHVGLPIKGASAGTGLTFANDLTLDYKIGASHISRIDANTLTMRVYSDNKLMKTFPVSLGAAKTPTFRGTKIVMEKHNPQRMIGPGYNELVPYSVRITLDGEFIHDAYWNTNIGRISTSNGCTNLQVAASIWFYKFAQVGDVAEYPNAPGKLMPNWDGYGDWNVNWTAWKAGGSAVGP